MKELKKYAVLTYVSDGMEVHDRVELDGVDDEALIAVRVEDIFLTSNVSSIDVITRFTYEEPVSVV